MAPDSPGQDGRLAQQLQRLIQSIEMGGRAVLPRSDDALLRSIVEAAAAIFGAAAASIMLVDERAQTLVFRVTTGAGNPDLVGMSFPLDQGIAGYVAMTGQPIAISDVQHDPRFASGFAKQTGYVPRSILAMPLLEGDRVIGVMEVLDKVSAPSFGMQDMELLAVFAGQAAIAIAASQQMENVGHALLAGLRRLAVGDGSQPAGELLTALEISRDECESEDMLALADLFNQIGSLGPAERQLCLKTLTAFAEYTRSRPGPTAGGWPA
jgi:GAF domain-containing protein